jgi:hypothetical protein
LCAEHRAEGLARVMGLDVRPENIERIWPLGFQQINMLGRYSFDLPEQLTCGELRSLRDPSDAADEEVLVAQTGFSFHRYPRPILRRTSSTVSCALPAATSD